MRVCHIIEPTSGGSARAMLSLARGQLQAGEDVTLIYGTERSEPVFFHQLQQLAKLKAHELGMRRSVGLHDFRSAIELYKLLKKLGPFDILHAHSSKAGGLVRLVAPLLPKAKIVYTPHAFVTLEPGLRHKIFTPIEWFLSLWTDAIITVSVGERRHAVEDLFISPDKIHVISNGLPSSFSQPGSREAARQEMAWDDSVLVVGAIGRISHQKNPQRLMESFDRAYKKCSSLRLLIMGNGELLSALQDDIEARGLGSVVKLWIDRDARPYFPGLDVLLCSSNYEGFPLVFIEALNAGVPIITTPVGGAEEAVLSGQTGFRVESFNPAALAEALVAYAALAPAQREEMARRAKEHALQFSEEGMVAQTHQLYKELLAGRSA